jgi:pimeloyl-ACP methyl ester carboxylesterase
MSDMIPTLPGINSSFVDTPRLRQHVLSSGPADGIPVVLLHGNFSAATFWEDLMLQLAEHGFRCIAPDLRGYGWTEDQLLDSTRGYRDWSDDLHELVTALNLPPFHLVGWSASGGVVYRYVIEHGEMVRTVTLNAPVSPYGFGGSKGIEGTPCYEDFAGSGGGVVNPVFVQHIQMNDRGTEDPNSPLNVMRGFYYKAPFQCSREEDYLTAALQEKTGADKYPGDYVPSGNWPNVAPGQLGPVNCWSPKYVANDAQEFLTASHKPPILWIRGDSDMIVGDMSFFDFGTLGKLGYVPGWPGDEVYPPQPMVSQTRDVLEKYAAAGGKYQEVVFADCGHSPHIEHPEQWLAAFLRHVKA